MKAIITSIGERTADLCNWSLERLGFEVEIYSDGSTLADKLRDIYNNTDEDFLRVDADVVVNRNVSKLAEAVPQDVWWVQALTYDWFKQDLTHGGVNFYKREALPALRANIDAKLRYERPETEMSRIKEFYEPRRFETVALLCGLHSYKNDATRVRLTKARRGQEANYDWELAKELDKL
jgi:hypothetical protein